MVDGGYLFDCSDVYPNCVENEYDCTYDPADSSTWASACGGSAAYDCRYGNSLYDQSESAVAGYCAIDTTGKDIISW